MNFKEWAESEKLLEVDDAIEVAEIAWNKALEIAAKEVNKIALHHNTVVCASDVINRNRTDL